MACVNQRGALPPLVRQWILQGTALVNDSPYRQRLEFLIRDPWMGRRQFAPGKYSNCLGTALRVIGFYDAQRPVYIDPSQIRPLLASGLFKEKKEHGSLVLFYSKDLEPIRIGNNF